MDGDNVFIVDPETGKRGYVPRGELEKWGRAGYQLETPEATDVERRREEYGGQEGQAFLEGAAGGLTFGGSDLALRALDPEGSQSRAEFSPVARMGGELGGALLGGSVGAGGALTHAGQAAERLVVGEGAQLGARVLGAGVRGVVEGVGYGVGAGVSEVALSPEPMTWEGAASTIGSNALGGALVGGALGGGLGLLGEGARAAKAVANKQVEALTVGEKGVAAIPDDIRAMDAKTASAAYSAESNAVKAAHRAENETVAAEIGAEKEAIKSARVADLAEGQVAKEAEISNLKAAKDEAARAYHENAKAFKNELRANEDYFIKTADRESARVLQKSKLKIMGSLDNAEKFVTTRGSEPLLEGLQTQKEALTNILEKAESARPVPVEVSPTALLEGLPIPTMGKLGKRVTLNADQAAIYEQYADFANLPSRVRARDFNVSRSELTSMREAIGSGEFKPNLFPDNQAAIEAFDHNLQNAQNLLDHNQAMIDSFKELRKPLASDALTAIEARIKHAELGIVRTPHLVELETKAAGLKGSPPSTPRMDHLKAHLSDLQAPKGIGHSIAQGAGGLLGGAAGMAVAGPVGAMAGGFVGRDVGSRLYERFVRKVISSNAARQKSIKAAIATMFESGASKAGKTLPRATAILATTRYASADHVEGVLGPARMVTSKDSTVEAFRERAREINALTERGPNGVFKVRQQALEAVHDRMAGVWAMADAVANGIEKTHQARLEFLASKLPRDPTPPHLQAGPSNWEPTKPQMAEFARIMEVAERPEKAIERLSDGTATPNDVETLKAVYPSHYEDVRQQCFDKMAVLQHRLPYTQRLNLSILLDVPVDPALTPEAMSVYQMPPPPPEAPPTPSQNKPLPTGMVAPTAAQHASSS